MASLGPCLEPRSPKTSSRKRRRSCSTTTSMVVFDPRPFSNSPVRSPTRGYRPAIQTSFANGSSHTVAVMQTRDQLERVASETALDLARDGVVYAEVRFAPELHTGRGLKLDEVVTAVLAGFDHGMRQAELEGRTIIVRAILSAMRQNNRSEEIAALAVRFRDEGVCGFDIAGPEDGFPLSGKPSSSVTPNDSVTEFESSTISPRSATVLSWADSRATSGTAASLSRSALRRTSTPARHAPLLNTPSRCSANSASG